MYNSKFDILEIMQIACDEFCKYREKLSQEELEVKCGQCELAERVDKLNQTLS